MELIKRFKNFFKDKTTKSDPHFMDFMDLIITKSEIIELKDLFIEFCDEFDFKFKEVGMNGYQGDNKIFVNKVINTTQLDQLTYSNNSLEDDTYGFYTFFAINVSTSTTNMDTLGKMVTLLNSIYDRILYMGYRCYVTPYYMGDNRFIIFRIGRDNKLKNNNNLNYALKQIG
jgi:hypothetical protein